MRLEEATHDSVTSTPQSASGAVYAPEAVRDRIAPTHRLVMITEETNWTELEELVQAIRRSKLTKPCAC